MLGKWILSIDRKRRCCGIVSSSESRKEKAEQMILTLKGKLKFSESEVLISSNKKTITSALINLGFRANDVEVVVSKFSSDMDVQAGIRVMALGQLSSVSP